MYYERDAEDGTILCNDELVDTRNGYTYRVITYNHEHDTLWIRYSGIRERDWEQLSSYDDEDGFIRTEYADTIASLCVMHGMPIPESVCIHLKPEEPVDESVTIESSTGYPNPS